MPSSEDVITRIIDIDTKAEDVKIKAIDDAGKLKLDFSKKMEAELNALEIRITEKRKQINEISEKSRNSEIEKVRKDFAVIADSIKNTGNDKIDKVVDIVLSRIKGSTE
jgi:hypothetical protein